jgi:hypothetical protein
MLRERERAERRREREGDVEGIGVEDGASFRHASDRIVAHVDMGEGKVTSVSAPPPHVRWGDISTPMF